MDCLDILLHKGVSGLPVVERNTYKVVDMYSRFDAIGVALENKLDQLDVTVEQALAFRNTFRVTLSFIQLLNFVFRFCLPLTRFTRADIL